MEALLTNIKHGYFIQNINYRCRREGLVGVDSTPLSLDEGKNLESLTTTNSWFLQASDLTDELCSICSASACYELQTKES